MALSSAPGWPNVILHIRTSRGERKMNTVPQGYRQGLITSITVFLGFSLAFLRFWAFEAPGDWTTRSAVVAVGVVVAILLEIYSLYRALRIEDDTAAEYRKTVRWFVASTAVMLLGLFIAAVVLSSVSEPR
jgi:hypothetical protein